jgi:hypothetical protein
LIGKGIREEEGTETRILNMDKYINKNVYKVKIFYKGKAEILIITMSIDCARAVATPQKSLVVLATSKAIK